MKTLNIKFPIKDNNVTNSLFSMTNLTKEMYSSNLMLLLLTSKGQRYYDPDYGTNLLYYLFENDKKIVQQDVISDIKESVSRYIPNLTINDVIFNYNDNDNDENQLNLLIQFTYQEENFSESGNITINF
ncbi:MAG: GPW/gp25 family protein [bacterium]